MSFHKGIGAHSILLSAFLALLFLVSVPPKAAAEGTALQNCLCNCLVGKTNFSCTFDTSDSGYSPSCANLSNGQCICKANGCFRKPIPQSGACHAKCLADHGTAQQSTPLQSRPLARSGEQEYGFDRPGRNIANFTVSSSHECQAACTREGRCKAWTFVKAGLQGAQPRCWLKGSAPGKVRNSCCISGLKETGTTRTSISAEPPTPDDPDGVIIPKYLFMQSVRFAIEQSERSGLSSRYFSIAEKERFLGTVNQWLAGVAEDSEYLRYLVSIKDYPESFFWRPKLTLEGFTQPKGWTGLAQAIGSTQSYKYNGFIILNNFQPQNPTTPFHEAIHAFAYAVGAGELDNDHHGGPEFISAGFRSTLSILRKRDGDFCRILDAYAQRRDVSNEAARLNRSLDAVERIYRNQASAPQVEQLLRLMGGRVDWRGYREHINRDLRIAHQTFLAGRVMERHPACY